MECGWNAEMSGLIRSLALPHGRLSAVLDADDEFEAGPGFVHGADFDVHETEREGEFADDVFVDGGGHARRFFWPGNPEHSCWGELLEESREELRKLGTVFGEELDEIQAGVFSLTNAETVGQRAEGFDVTRRRVEELAGLARLEAEFFDERRAGVAGHVGDVKGN